MKRVPLIEATASQLAEFATTNLGLDVQFRMGSDKIRAVMATSGYDKDFIEIEEDTTEPVKLGPAVADARGKRRILIHQQDDDKDPVFVRVNGRAMLIPRGEESVIPFAYYEALKNAKRAVYDSGRDGGMGDARFVPQYPFTDLGVA